MIGLITYFILVWLIGIIAETIDLFFSEMTEIGFDSFYDYQEDVENLIRKITQ